MATKKKASPKKTVIKVQVKSTFTPAKKTHKMDRYFVSKQPWEITHVRSLFFQVKGEFLVHPTKEQIIVLIKKFNNSRTKIYQFLRNVEKFKQVYEW